MLKYIDFWGHLCNVLSYRFFAGVPCEGLVSLYKKMDSNLMHYIPAASEQIAVGLANGAYISGIKSAILMASDNIEFLNLSFNFDNNFFFFIAYGEIKPKFKQGIYCLDLTEDLEACLNKIDKHLASKRKPCVLFIGKGLI